MYCPNCAAPIDGVKFCRSCGTNVSLVPQALTGQLPAPVAVEEDWHTRHGRRGRRRGNRPPTIEGAANNFFIGLGFLFVSLAVSQYAPAGHIWWFWLLIPAFSCMGAGVGQYLKLKELARQQQFPAPQYPPANFPAAPAAPAARLEAPSAPTTSELATPVSVTEHTTRHLEQNR